MEVYRISSRLFLLLGILCLVTTLQGVQGGVESEGPSESECRPYIEKALKELETAEATGPITPGGSDGESKEEEEEISTVEITTDDSDHAESDGDNADNDIEAQESKESTESAAVDEADGAVSKEEVDDDHSEEQKSEEVSSEVKVTSAENGEEQSEEHEEEVNDQAESEESQQSAEIEEDTGSEQEHSIEDQDGSDETEDKTESAEINAPLEDKVEVASDDESAENDESTEANEESTEAADEEGTKSEEDEEQPQGDEPESQEDSKTDSAEAEAESQEHATESAEAESTEDIEQESAEQTDQKSAEESEQESDERPEQESAEETEQESAEEIEQGSEEQTNVGTTGTEDSSAEDDKPVDEADVSQSAEKGDSAEDEEPSSIDEGDAHETGDDVSNEAITSAESIEEIEKEESTDNGGGDTDATIEKDDDNQIQEGKSSEETVTESDKIEALEEEQENLQDEDIQTDASESQERIKREEEKDSTDEEGLEEMVGRDEETVEGEEEKEDSKEKEMTPEEELINEGEIPDNLRSTDHIAQLLKLDNDNLASEKIMNGVAEITLRDLKRLYENAIKPLETLYKYRDLSNRHFGDSEIFSKPLVLFMGPWSGGKSSIINYLLNNEYNETSLRTGAEPSPAYFNILMYGEEPEVLDGTQLAADFTFSGLQKFGQGLEERLRGLKLPQKLLQKINIVEIPGILEVRKQISRVFPFNDACQWFIDRADIIYLIYDPSKLDVGPETEAILDQLKGREHQTRIILNKADQVKPEELMRVQGALIWNISPLMSSAQPPVMYTTSLWSKPYEPGAPVRLLQAQERAYLRDLGTAIDKRIENKIASARRFAVRVRNHAKMVDCYLTTYYNHKSVFGNRKQVADAIIEHPQDYHIYEGLSTLTNISRYDLPDPDVYRDFFRLNPLYEFQQLSATCTYFRGCPINRLDVAIAYDLPELIGKHKRMVEAALAQANLSQTPGS